jgi:hypothetical protein
VPNDERKKITISWNAINNGHGSVDEIAKQIGNKALDAAETNKNPWVVVGSIVGRGILNFAFADCDMELFSQGLVIDGALLYNLAGHDDWKPDPDNPGFVYKVFDYPGIYKNCDFGHYNLVVLIKRQP